jgi:hypothetical protein
LIGYPDNQAAEGLWVLDAFHAGDFGGPHWEEFVQQGPLHSRGKAPGALFQHFLPGFEVVRTILPVQGFYCVKETFDGGVIKLFGFLP